VRLGVDVGQVRVGVAACDPGGVLASPIAVLQRDVKRGGDLEELVRIADERSAMEVVVGLPRSLSGAEGKAAQLARDYATLLAKRVAPVTVRLVDERLSTVQATRGLQQAGVRAREGRKVIDAAAAAVILQHALDAEREGNLPGGTVDT
jgi:putative Holliday junction resolvase